MLEFVVLACACLLGVAALLALGYYLATRDMTSEERRKLHERVARDGFLDGEV